MLTILEETELPIGSQPIPDKALEFTCVGIFVPVYKQRLRFDRTPPNS